MPEPSSDFIHRFDPPAPGESRGLLLLHGTGGDEHDLIPIAEAVAPGFARLSPRGKVNEGTANRFFRRLAEGVFDEVDLKTRADELADFVSRAAARYGVAVRRLTALGYSNGANIAAAMLLRRPDAVGAAVLIRPMVPFEPADRVDLAGRRILAIAGQFDPTAPARHLARLEQLLAERGAVVEARTIPAGHALTQADLELVKRWLAARPEAS
jgi:phospholipase/carboxylesterase